MTKLDDAKVQGFLAGKQMVVLATVKADGGPLARAMWFVHDRTTLAMISEGGLPKVGQLRRDPRVCVVAEAGEDGGELRGVVVQGRAEFLEDGAERRALVDRFHEKYAALKDYWKGRAMPADRVMFRIVPTQVREWGL